MAKELNQINKLYEIKKFIIFLKNLLDNFIDVYGIPENFENFDINYYLNILDDIIENNKNIPHSIKNNEDNNNSKNEEKAVLDLLYIQMLDMIDFLMSENENIKQKIQNLINIKNKIKNIQKK